jgi:hypothetical protein
MGSSPAFSTSATQCSPELCACTMVFWAHKGALRAMLCCDTDLCVVAVHIRLGTVLPLYGRTTRALLHHLQYHKEVLKAGKDKSTLEVAGSCSREGVP